MHDDDFLEPELRGLPDDPMLAFVVYEQRLRPTTRYAASSSGWDAERRYAMNLWKFIELEGLPIPVEGPPPEDQGQFPSWYNEFVKRLDDHLFEYRLARARGRHLDVVAAISFSQDYREEIAALLNRVRKVVNQAELEDAKKEAIYKKISALQLEIDRSTTALGALFSRWLDLTNAIGEGAENLEPAVKLLERIARIFGRAKADHDQGQLPAPEEKKQLPAPQADYDNLDDWIPPPPTR